MAENKAEAGVIDDPKTVTMSESDMMKIEREIQLGERDTLADGRKISAVQKELEELQVKQDQQRSIPDKSEGAEKPEEVISRYHFGGGVTAAMPTKAEEKEASKVGDAGVKNESDIPTSFPGYKLLLDSGTINNIDLKKFTYDDFIVIGYDDATARKAVDALLKMNNS